MTDPAPQPGSVEESEERFRSLARALAEIVWVTGPEGLVLDLAEWRSYTGQTREQAAGLRWLDAVHPEDRGSAHRAWTRALRSRGEIPYDVEYRLRGADGVYRWFHARGIPIFEEDGSLREWVGVCINVDAQYAARQERERLVEELELERHRLRDVFEQAPVAAALLTGPRLRFELANPAYERMVGRTDVVGRPLAEVFPQLGTDAPIVRVLEAVSRTGDTFTAEEFHVPLVGEDGELEERYFQFTARAIRDRTGAIFGVLVVAVDVTPRVLSARALEESEARFRTLADNIPQLAWMADHTGWIFWYNRRWFEYTGTTLEQMRGWGWKAVHHPEHVDRVVRHFTAAIGKGERWEDTFPLRRHDGRWRWFLSRALPIRDESGAVVRWFGTNTDVTEQREAAAEREKLFQQAQAASRTKSDFMATMSHELRTPLNAILGYADLLEMREPLPDDAARYVDRIRLAARHQKQLIEDVLTFSRIDAGHEETHVETFPIDPMLREISAVLAPQAEAGGLRLDLDVDGGLPELRTDPRKLRQILINLLGNAIKFTGEGQVSLRVELTEREMRFEVRDSGPGIEAEHVERLFEPFWQADRSLTRTAEGSGLGLSISQRFAHMLGGDIEVDSVPGAGSTFTLVLPRSVLV